MRSRQPQCYGAVGGSGWGALRPASSRPETKCRASPSLCPYETAVARASESAKSRCVAARNRPTIGAGRPQAVLHGAPENLATEHRRMAGTWREIGSQLRHDPAISCRSIRLIEQQQRSDSVEELAGNPVRLSFALNRRRAGQRRLESSVGAMFCWQADGACSPASRSLAACSSMS